jgi:oxygen-independent coproporphyrinogen-3 oxidase
MEKQKDYLQDEPVRTIYLGGGTPSLLTMADITKILEAVYEHFTVERKAEITIEANPDDVSSDWIRQLKDTAVNRLSLGVQSFYDEDLKYLNRVHDAAQARNAIELLQREGYHNFSIDLIYGIPGLTLTRWNKNLDTFRSMGIPHLSAYALTVEPKTALENLIRKKKIQPPAENDAVAHFKALQEKMESSGYIHYEISNFALEGFYSKHNSLYWTGGHYLGLGPSAHSYNGHSRRWNKSSMKDWFALDEYFSESYEEEVLTRDQRYNEYVMTSLRTVWGCDKILILQEFGPSYQDHFLFNIEKHVIENMIEERKGRFFLTSKGKLFADGIAADLFK